MSKPVRGASMRGKKSEEKKLITAIENRFINRRKAPGIIFKFTWPALI
jgi:hypothetical protein